MSLRYKFKIVCGLHRSGTTYTGNILSKNGSVQIIHEPCSPHWGMKDVQKTYSYLDLSEQNEQEMKALMDDILHFRSQWGRKPPWKIKPVSEFSYRMWGGPLGITWSKLRMRHLLNALPSNVCWKDPFVTFALDYLLPEYNAQAICMIRHPGSLWYSNRKLDWSFDINILLNQKRLIEQYGMDIPDKHWQAAASNPLVSLALLWKVMARLISAQEKTQSALLTVRHEDLCVQPLDVTEKICKHLNLDFEHGMRQYIKQTSSGTQIEPSKGVMHSFTRDSKSIINAWRDKVTAEEEKAIRDVIGDDLKRFYDTW